jgi:lactoylglutathione lyase
MNGIRIFPHCSPGGTLCQFQKRYNEFQAVCAGSDLHWGKQHYDLGTAFGHVTMATDDIYETCEVLAAEGINITRMPMPMKDNAAILIALLEDQESYKVELIQLQRTIPCTD